MRKILKPILDETNQGEYILIKIPRQSARQNQLLSLFPFHAGENFRRTVWILCCILFLLIGMAIGVLFHGKLLHESTNIPVWKTASLQNSINH